MKKSVAFLSSAFIAFGAIDASAGDSPPATAVPSQPTPPAAAPGAGLPPPMQTSVPSANGSAALTSADADESVTPMPASPRPVDANNTTIYQKRGPNRPLLFTGAGIFLGSYATTAALTAADSTNKDSTMFVPIVGPWLHLADQNENTRDSLLIAGSGVLQGAGVGLLIASFFVSEKVPAATIQGKNMTVQVTPTTFGPASAGFGAIGTF